MTPGPAPPRQVLRNWLWLVGAQVLVRLVALGYKVFLARRLGPDGYGQYAWVLTTVLLCSIIVEAGFNRLVIRDVARDPTRGPALVGAVARVRGWLAGAVFGLMLGTFLVVPTERTHFLGLAIVGLTLFLYAAGMTWDAAFYAAERVRFSGVGQIIVTVLGAAFGVAAILAGLGLPGLFVGVVVAEAVRVGYLYVRLGRIDLRPAWRPRLPLRPLLHDALPYALLAIFGVIYFRIDTVMLGPLRGDAETGVYTAAYKLFEVLMFVPGTLAAVVLPRMARYHADDLPRLQASHARLTRLLFAVAVPITAALWLESDHIIALLFGAEYAASAPVLRVLAITFLFHCLHTANATLVLSGTVLAPVVWLSLLTAGTNVILNVLFIPRYGATAAALTTLASEWLSWVLFTAFIHMRVVRLTGWGGAMWRPGAAAIMAALTGWALWSSPPAAYAGAAVVYVGASAMLGVLTREDLALFKRAPAEEQTPESPVDLA